MEDGLQGGSWRMDYRGFMEDGLQGGSWRMDYRGFMEDGLQGGSWRMDYRGVHGGWTTGRFMEDGKRNQEGRMLLEFCDAKHLCIANTWLRKADKKKIR